MTKMLGFGIVSFLLLTVAASAVPLGEIWNFSNERVFGKVKKVEEFDESGLLVRAVYYNEKGQNTRIEDYFDGKLTNKYTMEYNKDGDPYRASYYFGVGKSPDFIETAEYEAKGIIKYIICKHINGEEEQTLKTEPFKYDEKKRLKSIKLEAKDGLIIDHFKFDDKGNCTELIADKEGRWHSERKFGKYNNGVPETREMQVVYSRGKVSKMSISAVCKYKFDKTGNWIEIIAEKESYFWGNKDKNPELRKSTFKQKRKITYYPEKKKLN